jgi:adenylylsulfate kinase
MKNDVLWLIGVSGAGKTTVAKELQQLVRSERIYSSCVLVDADAARQLWPELGLSKEDRGKNMRRLAKLARMVATQLSDTLVVVANIAPYATEREIVKDYIESSHNNYYEVYLHAPLAERVQRDPKGLYARAIAGEITGLTGYDGDYEVPTQPNLKIDTGETYPWDAAEEIIEMLMDQPGEKL